MDSLTTSLKAQASRLGFELVGIVLPHVPPGMDRYLSWLNLGFAGEMTYLKNGAQLRQSVEAILPGTKSLLVMGINYRTRRPAKHAAGPHGRIAQYALGQDYHEVLWKKLTELGQWLEQHVPGSKSRGVVDTAPMLEREMARSGGLGWFGKNTMLIHKQLGSFFFLATLLTTVELEPDPPHLKSHCGTCTACLQACPTQAFPEPGTLDATQCISYLTIELKSPIPRELRSGLGNWIFGCDVCQDVCPWNSKAPLSQEPSFASNFASGDQVDLIELLSLTPEDFRNRFRHTSLWRARRRGILRNAAIVLGNQRLSTAIPALASALQDEEALVRGAAAWALGQFQPDQTAHFLHQRLLEEQDDSVKEEIVAALAQEAPDLTSRSTAAAPRPC